MTTKQFKENIYESLYHAYTYFYLENDIKKKDVKTFDREIKQATENVYNYFKDIIKVSAITSVYIYLKGFKSDGENFYSLDSEISIHYGDYKFIKTHCFTCISNW